MPFLRKRSPPIKEEQPPPEIPETVLLETSYDEELGSSQIMVSKLPFPMSVFLLEEKGTMKSAPPLLDEVNSDSDSSFDSLEKDFPVFSKITAGSHGGDVEVKLDDGDSFYTAIMSSTSEECESLISGSNKKRVCFSTAEYREYNVVVGDHPVCASGLPLALDWKYNPITRIVDLTCPTNKESNAPRGVQRLSLLERMKLLKEFHDSEQVWLAERRRRKELEEENAILEEKANEDDDDSSIQGYTQTSLCDCSDSFDDDDESHSVVPYNEERTLMHPYDSCEALTCLEAL